MYITAENLFKISVVPFLDEVGWTGLKVVTFVTDLGWAGNCQRIITRKNPAELT